MDACEAVEKRLGQAAAAAALLHRVLRRKHAEAGRAGERLGQLGDVHFSPVVQEGVQTLKNALTCRQAADPHLNQQGLLIFDMPRTKHSSPSYAQQVRQAADAGKLKKLKYLW